MANQTRLDQLLVERGLCASREKAQALILAGSVWSGERRLEKPGMSLTNEVAVEIRGADFPHVSRAGSKLAHALKHFQVSCEGRVCLDIGASTGGFTDCLLQSGAKHVFSVDVGYGQLDMKLRSLPQVSVLERTNARHLKLSTLSQASALATDISLVVADVSFISLRLIVPALVELGLPVRDYLFLFKPQFEVGRAYVKRGGIVTDGAAIATALAELDAVAHAHKLERCGAPENSPLAGKKSGNVECLLRYAPIG